MNNKLPPIDSKARFSNNLINTDPMWNKNNYNSFD
jgi:hypothetical protein